MTPTLRTRNAGIKAFKLYLEKVGSSTSLFAAEAVFVSISILSLPIFLISCISGILAFAIILL